MKNIYAMIIRDMFCRIMPEMHTVDIPHFVFDQHTWISIERLQKLFPGRWNGYDRTFPERDTMFFVHK